MDFFQPSTTNSGGVSSSARGVQGTLLEVDLPTSRFYKKLDRFISRTRHPQAFAMDVLVRPWDYFCLIYAFLQLNLHLLYRIQVKSIPVILITPGEHGTPTFVNLLAYEP